MTSDDLIIVGEVARAHGIEGQVLGRVVDVLRTGSNDVYVVRPPEGPEIFLPAVDSCIEKIDPAAGELVARLPEWFR